MQQHSETWSRIVANGDFRLETVAVIDGAEYSTITAPVITNGLLTDKKLSVGNCIAGTLEFSVMTNNPIAKSAQVVIKSRVTDETDYSEWLELGTFWVDHRSVDESLDEKLTTLACFDAMLKGNQPYVDNSQTVVWPKPMTTVVARICEQMGVPLDSRTVIKTGADYVVTKPDDETTLLDILSWIGQLHGGNWTITQQGKLRLVPLVSAPSETFYVIDENRRRIITPEGDNLAWRPFENDVPEGIDYINVPVILGDVTTSDNPTMGEMNAETDIGAYTKISGSFSGSAETYFQGIVGKGVDGTKTTSNYYATSGNIAVFRYAMPFDLPSDTQISRVYLEVNGHAESASAVSEYMCVQLFSGETALSDEYNFKTSGTSNTTITLECTTIPTVAQLASMQLQCRLGYYGGAINGATAYVEYMSVTSEKQSVTGVSITVDSETTYAAGTDAGIVLAFENPYATQNICNDLFAQVNGLIYATFNVTRAVFDPTVELGDLMYAGNLAQGVIYNSVQRYDIMYQADVSAPGEEELDSEYPVITPVQKMQYTVSELKSDNVVIHSEIRQTQSDIIAEVTRATGVESSLTSRLSLAEGSITAEVTRATNAETSIQQNYTPKSSIKSVFALDPTNITLSAGVDQQGNPTGQITFNAGSLIVNSTNFSLDANGIMRCNGAFINGEVTAAETSGNKKAVMSNAGLNFYQGSTLKGKISLYSGTDDLGIDCGDLVLDCDHIILPYDPEELPIEAMEDTIYVVTNVDFSTNTATYTGLHFIHGILAETVD